MQLVFAITFKIFDWSQAFNQSEYNLYWNIRIFSLWLDTDMIWMYLNYIYHMFILFFFFKKICWITVNIFILKIGAISIQNKKSHYLTGVNYKSQTRIFTKGGVISRNFRPTFTYYNCIYESLLYWNPIGFLDGENDFLISVLPICKVQ